MVRFLRAGWLAVTIWAVLLTSAGAAWAMQPTVVQIEKNADGTYACHCKIKIDDAVTVESGKEAPNPPWLEGQSAVAEAARIYAEAYGQDPEFYAFYQTLDAYKQTLQKNASVLLTTGSDFYRYLKYVNGVVPHATAKEGKP